MKSRIPLRNVEKASVLIADDDPDARLVMADCLEEAGFDVIEARSGEEALRQLSRRQVSVALLDLDMPPPNGMECLERIRKLHPDTESIIVTGSHRVGDAVKAMKGGAFEYLTKPVDMEELIALTERAAESVQLKTENRQLRHLLGPPRSKVEFVGASVSADEVRRMVNRVSPLDSTVLITGESGVGKGLVTRLIHASGRRRKSPLVTVNCTALPRELVEAELFGHEKGAFTGAHDSRPGKLEVAHGGTLFLDEIGDMPLETQPKLLVFLQERCIQRIGSHRSKSIDVRVIAATNQDLKKLCEEGRFRRDLYFRLDVLPFHIPPLRERREDIEELCTQMLYGIAARRGCPTFSISPEAMQALQSYEWPGNVRELENVLERCTAFAESSRIELGDIPAEVRPSDSPTPKDELALAGIPLKQLERTAIMQTLRLCQGSKSTAARLLGVSERTIYNKLKEIGYSD